MNYEDLSKKAEASPSQSKGEPINDKCLPVELNENGLNSNMDSNASNSSSSNSSNLEKLKDFVNILPEDAFVHVPPARYLFKGAEVYSRSDEDNSSSDDESCDDEQALIRNDDSNGNLSTIQNPDRQYPMVDDNNEDFNLNNLNNLNNNQPSDFDKELNKPNQNSLPPIDSNN